jgi:Flp pilus assembly protein protease CpaA
VAILHATEITSAVCGAVTIVAIFLLRFVWRRGKKLQEP